LPRLRHCLVVSFAAGAAAEAEAAAAGGAERDDLLPEQAVGLVVGFQLRGN